MKQFFETRIEQKRLGLKPAIQAELKRTALKLPEVDHDGRAWSKKNYPNGYTSYGSLSELHAQFSVFDALKRALDREVKTYVKKIGLTFPRGELALSSLWVNIMPKNCYHAFHLHPNSVVSGTYYLSVPKGSSPLRIEDPRSALFMASPPRKIQQDLTPKAGEVILFESWLKHEVPPHHSNEDRISVSFNYDWFQ
jgi:uncharacterized protein (TIGR02466 family)